MPYFEPSVAQTGGESSGPGGAEAEAGADGRGQRRPERREAVRLTGRSAQFRWKFIEIE